MSVSAPIFPECQYMCGRCRLVYGDSNLLHRQALQCLSDDDFHKLLYDIMTWCKEGDKINPSLSQTGSFTFRFSQVMKNKLRLYRGDMKQKHRWCLLCGPLRRNQVSHKLHVLQCPRKREFLKELWAVQHEISRMEGIVLPQSYPQSTLWGGVVWPLITSYSIQRVDMGDSKADYHLDHLTPIQWTRSLEHFPFGESPKELAAIQRQSKIQLLLGQPRTRENSIEVTYSGVTYLLRCMLQDPRNRNLMFSDVMVHRKRKVLADDGKTIRYLTRHLTLAQVKEADPDTAEQEEDIDDETWVTCQVYVWRKSKVSSSAYCHYKTLDSRRPDYGPFLLRVLEQLAIKLWASVMSPKLAGRRPFPIHPSHLGALQHQTRQMFGEKLPFVSEKEKKTGSHSDEETDDAEGGDEERKQPTNREERRTFDKENMELHHLFLQENLHTFTNFIPFPARKTTMNVKTK